MTELHFDPDKMTPGELEEIAVLLRERAATQRRNGLTLEEARELVASVPLSLAADASCLRGVLAVRAATRRLVLAGRPPAQIVGPLVTIALEAFDDVGVARNAVAYGIADAKRAAGHAR